MFKLPNPMSRRARRGMALPMVIVVLLVLGASFAGGVALARGERALDDAGMSNVVAQTWAETGLQRVIADRSALGLIGVPSVVGTPDSVRVTVSGGYYDVITTLLRPAVGTTVPGLFYLRAHAVVTQSKVSGAPVAEYTVTKLATFKVGTMHVQSALTGINGIEWHGGGAGSIDGNDACSGGTNVPGVEVPAAPGITGDGNNWSSNITGNPPIQNSQATIQAAATASPIDWDGIVNHQAITADYTVDCTASSCDTSHLPTSQWWTDHPTAFPVIMVNNRHLATFTMPSGRGLLIVTGNMTASGSNSNWNGVMLIGGRITSNGTTTVTGATVTGLNAKFGDADVMTNDLDVLNGTKQFTYNSCSVSSAMTGIGSLRDYPATWSSNFKTY